MYSVHKKPTSYALKYGFDTAINIFDKTKFQRKAF